MERIATVLLLVTTAAANAAVIGFPGGSGGRLYAGDAVGGGAPSAGADIDGGGYISNSASSASIGRGADVVHHRPKRTLFDDIFNIPTSVLQSVNHMLNNKQASEGVTAEKYGGHGNYAGRHYSKKTYSYSQSNANSNSGGNQGAVGSRSGAASSASTGSSATAGGSPGGHNVDYNAIFNIPISSLSSVNRLLNNLG